MCFRSCGCSDESTITLESLYGTYEGTDQYGDKVKIVLKPESDNEWRKYGEDWSDNLVYTDYKGRLKSTSWQTIKWTWDLNDGYVVTYYNSSERTVIDIKGGMMYDSWGEYLDKRNGFSYVKY